MVLLLQLVQERRHGWRTGWVRSKVQVGRRYLRLGSVGLAGRGGGTDERSSWLSSPQLPTWLPLTSTSTAVVAGLAGIAGRLIVA